MNFSGYWKGIRTGGPQRIRISAMKEAMVITVNARDKALGLMPKMEAHRKGILHRAISVFIFTSDGRWLLQQRAQKKYHSGGQWSNTCCSHPLPEEESEIAAIRRLKEEMGLNVPLIKLFTITYKAELENGLIEHELDHIFIGTTNTEPEINKEEVSNWKYFSMKEIQEELLGKAGDFTPWFRIIYKKVYQQMNRSEGD
jgi:isopentenyl-diphosphate Delta-isomerase